jgi:hypothetical protein
LDQAYPQGSDWWSLSHDLFDVLMIMGYKGQGILGKACHDYGFWIFYFLLRLRYPFYIFLDLDSDSYKISTLCLFVTTSSVSSVL